jgi:hypothetical protein
LFACSLTGSQRAWPAVAACLAVCLLAAAWASVSPAYSARHPRGLNIIYYGDGPQPRWLIETFGPPDEAYLAGNGFPARDEDYLQGGSVAARGRLKPTGDLQLPYPALTLGERSTVNSLTSVKATLHGGRGGMVGIVVDPGSGIHRIRSEGPDAFVQSAGQQGPAFVRFHGVPGRPVNLESAYPADTTPTLVVYTEARMRSLRVSVEAGQAGASGRTDGFDITNTSVSAGLKLRL